MLRILEQFDAYTVVVLSACTAALMAVVLAVLRHQYPRRIAGLGLWSLALALSALGTFLGMLYDTLTPLLSITGARTALLGSTLAAYCGAARFFGQPANERRWLLALGVTALVHGVMTVTWPTHTLRVLVRTGPKPAAA